MRNRILTKAAFFGSSALALGVAGPALAEEADAGTMAMQGETIIVTGARTTFNSNITTETMIAYEAPLTSPLSMIDKLPGVSVNEGDQFGFDDWSTAVAVRGFQTNLSEQQVGITIDGLPNGGSNYGGGSKANRYIDSMNIGTVEVSQGTADIASLSNEALGGTLNFVTSDPLQEMRAEISGSLGDFRARRAYGRIDTGTVLNGAAQAWVSASYQEATDWVGKSAQNNRTHIAGKFTTNGAVKLTGYAAWDKTHEDNYDQIYSAARYEAAPHTDGLTTEWTGIPYQDQAYRRAWSTLRTNTFAYLKAEAQPLEAISFKAAAYYHHNRGRGDWVPQYVVDVIADGAGNPQSELFGGHADGGSILGQIFFVDASGRALTPTPGCVGALTFPYGGTTNPVYDPSCYPAGAIGAQSYRHTHYRKERIGGTGEVTWEQSFGAFDNRLRAGLWYEDAKRKEWRDWSNVIDTTVGPEYNHTPPYWTQYSREYPQDTFKWYVEDEVTLGPVKANFGIKKFVNHLERQDLFGESAQVKLKSSSDVLLSGGVTLSASEGVNLFVGYAENFKAITDSVLERTDADFSQLSPETSENWEGGMRFNVDQLQGSVTFFKSKFANRLIFLAQGSVDGIDYLEEASGSYINVGGVDTEGVELLLNWTPTRGLNLYGSYTYLDATYKGTGNPEIDVASGFTPGNRVAGIPKDMFVVAGDYATGPFRAGISGKYTGKRMVNRANTWEADGNFVADAYIGVDVGEFVGLRKADLSVTVNNLFDEDYLGGISGDYAWIGAPRTVVFTLTADF